MTKSIMVFNFKGGAGKTTISRGLATALAEMNYKILLIDTDPQGNLSEAFGYDPFDATESDEPWTDTLYYCIENKLGDEERKTSSFIRHTDNKNIDIITGDINLTVNRIKVEISFSKEYYVYKEIIDDLKAETDYDFIIMDASPSLGAENSQVMMGCDYILIPTTLAKNSIKGIRRLLGFCDDCRELGSELEVAGIVMNNVNKKLKQTESIMFFLKQSYEKMVLDSVIYRDARGEKLDWEGLSTGSNQFYTNIKSVAEELLKRIG